MVPAYSVKVPLISTLLWIPPCQLIFRLRGFLTFSGRLSQTVLLNLLNQLYAVRTRDVRTRFGLFRFRSPLLTESHVVFSSSGYLDVSVHRVPFLKLCIGLRILEVCSSGFPHSDISGSKDICSSPKLFAAYHVFHRLLVPRHPPYALSSMTNLFSSTGMDDHYTDIALSALA